MSDQLNLFATPSATSSPASAGGAAHCALRNGPTPAPSGPEAAPASPSASPEREKARRTNATSGPSLAGSLPPANLQSCLASRLQARLDAAGSPEYRLIWKEWVITSALRICALRASARHTSGRDFIGWQTPTVQDSNGRDRHNQRNGTVILSLLGEAKLAGRATPRSRDWKDTPGMSTTGTNPDGSARTRLDQLPRQVTLVSGMEPSGTVAPTERRAGFRLNPGFSLWLMGYPPMWACCGERAMPSSRNSRRSSSSPPPKP